MQYMTLQERSAKRATLKSPVRENRTPGFVRGHPGDRVPYLDLKNEGGLLPLDLKRISRVAVIGGNAGKKHSPAGGGLPGGGSSAVKPLHEITPVEGLLARLDAQGVTVTHAPGYSADAAGAEGVSKLVGASGETSITGEGGAVSAVGAVSAAVLQERAVAAAKAADVVIYAGGFDHSVETEMKDRVDMSLPHGQVELIRALVAANPRTVIVLIGGSAMEMDAWVRDARAVLFAPYGGSEGGAALARILSGDANPSGKLPVTLACRLEDYAPHADGDSTSYPGTKERVWYREGIFTGYRFFDARGIEPLFCFGHGLSYTQFRHDDMRVGRIGGEGAFNVSFRLTNTGVHAGAEVAQVYVSQKNPRIERPVRELKGFAKVFLKPGESRDVTITLKADAFAYYDTGKSAWVTPAGEYVVAVGSSSRDIRLEAPVVLE
jgi:beta-glucosidase